MKIKNFRNYFLIGIAVFLALSSIFLTIETAVTGAAISDLEKKESGLLSEKQGLEETLVKTLSSSELQEKSAKLGFVKPANLVYVNKEEPVAKLP